MDQCVEDENLAYAIRRGHENLLANPVDAPESEWVSTTSNDFKRHQLKPKKVLGKRKELYEKFLFEEISQKVAKDAFRPGSPPSYITATKEHFTVKGFDPDKEFNPKSDRSLYLELPVTYWSENRRKVHGVSTKTGKGTSFPKQDRFTKPLGARHDNLEL